MMGKHAYLILAHNEFGLLSKLLSALDDSRNDVYIHFDKKVKELPNLKIKRANLIILQDRVDVCWGDVSVMQAEYELFKASKKVGGYSYYHLLSGVDLPLKSQDEIHGFFKQNSGKEFIGFSQYDYVSEVDRKICRVHLFSKSFRSSNLLIKGIRSLWLRLQLYLGMRRNVGVNFKKGTQWVSVTDEFVGFLLTKESELLKIYNNTFCCDEIVIQTICWNSKFRERVYDIRDEAHGCMRKIGWQESVLVDWLDKDYDEVINSGLLFARKFNSSNMDIVNKILNKISIGN